MQTPVVFADEGVAGIGARRDRGERKARVELGGQVFEGVDGQVDAAVGESVFDFLDEDAFGVERGAIGEGFRRAEGGVLHAVASGADHFDFDGVAALAKLGGNVVRLPECELGTAGADTDGIRHAVIRIRLSAETKSRSDDDASERQIRLCLSGAR